MVGSKTGGTVREPPAYFRPDTVYQKNTSFMTTFEFRPLFFRALQN